MSAPMVNTLSGSMDSISIPILKRLSSELGLMIFAFCMILGPGVSTPACLLVLARDAVPYAEAKEFYLSINRVVTNTTLSAPKKLSGKPLAKIQHLTIVIGKIDSNRILATDLGIILVYTGNRTQTITIDVTKTLDTNLRKWASIIVQNSSLFSSLISALKSDVLSVEVVVDATRNTSEVKMVLLTKIMEKLGFDWPVTYGSAEEGKFQVMTPEVPERGRVLILWIESLGKLARFLYA
ncbi:hypothetical protein BKA65DRAFT_553678 [Rhexocercosporidium sp. MPI-PUGE-AT-0058]|nr:hypothetical protein BKA65DRAFT_553678 [Rhexocercosporidium sp. MPI-PUGE-AT-0058]